MTCHSSVKCLNPFEVREVLQAIRVAEHRHFVLSQSLWSQGGAASYVSEYDIKIIVSQSLWSQGGAARTYQFNLGIIIGLNPFEVREVLQVHSCYLPRPHTVSIPLKSGRCCKKFTLKTVFRAKRLNPFEVREVLQGIQVFQPWSGLVSIPLKSGRCCKRGSVFRGLLYASQSLWSQGGAARVLYKTFLLKSIIYLLIFVKNFLTKSYFPKFCKEHIFITEVLWHKFAFWSGFFERCVTFI